MFDVSTIFGPAVVLAFAVPLVTTGLIVGVVVWSIRRSVPRGDEPAVAELKSRLARGEIDTAEYQVRLHALTHDD